MISKADETRPSSSAELGAVNDALAALLNREPVDLVRGAERGLEDSLVVCGILGGKDVGKSTLINALAGMTVSPDEEEVGTGTTRPMAYVHRDAAAAYRRRFTGAPARLDVTEHGADAIRNLVLVDMPDFDSDLPDHAEIVASIAPCLDRVIWVVTPRKIGDRSWVELLPRVIKDGRNVFCVLNKTDEILGDEAYRGADAGVFWEDQRSWVREIVAGVGCAQGDSHQFLISAVTPTPEAFAQFVSRRWGDPEWTAFGGDRALVEEVGRRLADEMSRLRSAVLGPVSRVDADSLKDANRRVEARTNAERVRSHYELDDWAARLDQACDADYHQAALNSAFGVTYADEVGRRLAARLRRDSDLAEEVLGDRVAHWPLLRAVYWPMSWLVRRIGGRFAGTTAVAREERPAVFDEAGQTLADRVESYSSRVLADHRRVVRRFGLKSAFDSAGAVAERIQSRATALLGDLDRDVVETLQRSYRRPRFWRRWLLWIALFWFPLGQPIAEGLLQLYELNVPAGLLQIVKALSATHLLTGLGVVLVIYVALLAAMYARCVVAVRQARDPEAGGAGDHSLLVARLDDLLVAEAVDAVSSPFAGARGGLEALRQRLDRVSSSA